MANAPEVGRTNGSRRRRRRRNLCLPARDFAAVDAASLIAGFVWRYGRDETGEVRLVGADTHGSAHVAFDANRLCRRRTTGSGALRDMQSVFNSFHGVMVIPVANVMGGFEAVSEAISAATAIAAV